MRSPCGFQFSLSLETFPPKLAEYFEHDKPGLATFPLRLLDQVLVEQGCSTLKHRGSLIAARLAHRFGSFKRAAAHEDREPAEEALFLPTQQVVAPLQRVA